MRWVTSVVCEHSRYSVKWVNDNGILPRFTGQERPNLERHKRLPGCDRIHFADMRRFVLVEIVPIPAVCLFRPYAVTADNLGPAKINAPPHVGFGPLTEVLATHCNAPCRRGKPTFVPDSRELVANVGTATQKSDWVIDKANASLKNVKC